MYAAARVVACQPDLALITSGYDPDATFRPPHDTESPWMTWPWLGLWPPGMVMPSNVSSSRRRIPSSVPATGSLGESMKPKMRHRRPSWRPIGDQHLPRRGPTGRVALPHRHARKLASRRSVSSRHDHDPGWWAGREPRGEHGPAERGARRRAARARATGCRLPPGALPGGRHAALLRRALAARHLRGDQASRRDGQGAAAPRAGTPAARPRQGDGGRMTDRIEPPRIGRLRRRSREHALGWSG